MAKLTKHTQTSLSDSESLRIRAAWLYYGRGLTQKDIAENLGISRSTVIRMLDEARKRAEVQIWINPTPGDCTGLALELEAKFSLDEAIVVPGSGAPDETAKQVGAALGRFMSEVIEDNMSIGVGWGRTLSASLATFKPTPRQGTRVLSFLGGLLEAKSINPIDYSWQLASRLHAECMLFIAPLLVDSPETKRRLIGECGLDRLLDAAKSLDLAIISCGDLATEEGSMGLGILDQRDRTEILEDGAICDVCCNFLNSEGIDVAHPVQERLMTTDLETISNARHVVLASGGSLRAAAIRAAILRTGCNTLVTDESAARTLLELP